MSHAPIETGTPCPNGCGRALVVTRDAIGRPRARCPDCQGVNRSAPAVGTVSPLHRQEATSSRALGWPFPGTRCRHCGAPLLQEERKGRPRMRCADERRCLERAGRDRAVALTPAHPPAGTPAGTPGPQHGTAA